MLLRFVLFLGVIAVSAMLTATPVGAQPAENVDTEKLSPFDQSILDSKKSMMASPADALEFARAAEDYARSQPPSNEQTVAIATAYWLQAEALNRLNKANDAEPLIQRALGLIGDERLDTKLGGDLILARGRIARVLRNDQLALTSFHQAHDIFAKLGSTRYQALSLQELGSIYRDARDYERVLNFYERATNIHTNDPALDLPSYNNRANALRDLGRYTESIELYQKALEIAEQIESDILKARILSNIAETQVSAGDYIQALNTSDESLTVLEGTDGGEWRPIHLAVKAHALQKLGQLSESAAVIELVFEGLTITETTAEFVLAHKTAYEVYRELGQAELALEHFEAFKRLEDSAREIAASANNVLVAAEFDFTAQELEIANLNAAKLEDEIALRQAQSRQRTIMFSAIIGFAALITIGLTWGLLMSRRSRKRIEKINKSLEDSNIALEKANKAKTEFLATTSHEIRTPLNGILGLTQLMMADETLTEHQHQQIESIWGAGDTLLAVVNDILDVATIETGRFRIIKDTTNIPKLADQVAEIFNSNAQNKGVTLSVDTGNCPEAIITDGMRIRQVLFNLVSNAVKFTEKGRVSVTLCTRQTHPGEELSIVITDTGIGIPADQLEAIFEAFHQADSGRTRKFGGTGLGLSICKHIANALGGTITASSTVGEGSRFEFVIPLERPKTVSPRKLPAEKTSAVQNTSDLNVLVVEDNLLNRNVIRALIESHVSSVTLAEDGVQGVSATEQTCFDVILMDKQMPNMDGITAIKTIRQLSNGSEDTYIIAVTADAYPGAREELLEAGADEYVSKPINAKTLIDALQEAVNCGAKHSRSSNGGIEAA